MHVYKLAGWARAKRSKTVSSAPPSSCFSPCPDFPGWLIVTWKCKRKWILFSPSCVWCRVSPATDKRTRAPVLGFGDRISLDLRLIQHSLCNSGWLTFTTLLPQSRELGLQASPTMSVHTVFSLTPPPKHLFSTYPSLALPQALATSDLSHHLQFRLSQNIIQPELYDR